MCNCWVTPSMSDRVILSRLELMKFHIIPKSFPSIMKSSEGGAQMCQSCARIIRLNHFEKLGKNHFVSVVNKRAPGGHVSSKEMYQSVLREACDPQIGCFFAFFNTGVGPLSYFGNYKIQKIHGTYEDNL